MFGEYFKEQVVLPQSSIVCDEKFADTWMFRYGLLKHILQILDFQQYPQVEVAGTDYTSSRGREQYVIIKKSKQPSSRRPGSPSAVGYVARLFVFFALS